MEIQGNIDNVKKGRILTLALVISLSILFFKITQQSVIVNPVTIILRGVGYFIFSYIGLIWALRFQVTLHTLLYIVPQTSLFIFAEMIFLELFFFRRVGRVYEVLILIGILAILFGGIYMSFLMANIFNVSTIKKEIPLVQAARTVSFIGTLICTFFITVGIMDANFNIFITMAILLLTYTGLIFFHLRHMDISWERIGGYTALTLLFLSTSVIALAIVSQRHEVIALGPTVGGFISLEYITKKQRNMVRNFDLIQYVFLLVLTFILGIYYS
ncbi:MAG: hypothetical protein UT34_C0001G0337 [candidate division WS6 bacterium GW2011_GWF2_39_15]|uniref:Uncharacterized protein n=1 Tax=candidate division WS6 bacterium GW2011_GWF2_39_15 TaxID=1619100 RepID=A0A0G0QXE7_9BACT|nr:MAG: hypothetical protein UT34_C0001G0337 [candidate division WS6 bacterium GW2011_GWF2_39_15]